MSARFEVVPSGFFEDGVPLGRIENRPLHLREKGALTLKGREYVVLRESVLRTSYLLRAPDGSVRARGEAGSMVRESLLSRRMSVELKDAAAGMPREVLLFLVWLALRIHRNDSGDPAV